MGHVLPSAGALRDLLADQPSGPVTMLNLLRFRDEADYSGAPGLAPQSPISGREAYDRYAREVTPHLRSVGGQVVLMGAAAAPVVGPTEERWDLVLLVRYPSAQAFADFSQDPGYLEVVGHRTAALEDARLIPITD